MSLEARAGDLRAIIGEQTEGPLAGLFAAVVCNGCGCTEIAADPDDLADRVAGWMIGENLGDHDLCPECREKPPSGG